MDVDIFKESNQYGADFSQQYLYLKLFDFFLLLIISQTLQLLMAP